MRNCLKNRQRIYYSTFIGTVSKEKDGLPTGSYEKVYNEPLPFDVNITFKNNGRATSQPYGLVGDYDLVFKVSRKDFPFDEGTVFWVYNEYSNIDMVQYRELTYTQYKELEKYPNISLGAPRFLNNNYNYIVKFIGNTLNETTVFLKKVSINNV